MYEIWSRYAKTKFMAIVTVPHTITEEGYKWYRDEVFNFKESLTGYFAAKLTDDDLRNAIKVYNESRRLIERLYDIRKSENPLISGTDAFKLVTAAFWIPRDEYNHLLKEALDEISQREGVSDYRARVMIGGSACDDSSFIELVEGRGGLVVTDSLCFGTRYFFSLVEEQGDPLEAITKRYYHHNPCPRMLKEYGKRLQFTEKLAKGAKVDGVILQRISFCDNHGVDSPMLAKDLEAQGIPVLILEKEYMLSDIGRLKTRIEAFLERIERR
jgi:benzoyl-CoA reductase/2-hydroxyglutaryl-CoA dehydratase subunit BcrC/BadD/HgdB